MIAREIRRLLDDGSAIRRMWTLGRKLKAAHGAENVADLTLGNPVLPPPPKVLETLGEIVAHPPPGLHRYTPNAGLPEVRERIAAHLHGTGLLPGAEGGHVVVTGGASAAVNVALRAVLDPGDEVVLLAPWFPDYPAHVMNHGGVPVPVSTGEDFLPDLEALYLAMGRKTRAVIVNHPNNPSGRQYPAGLLRKLADLLAERGRENGRPVYLISDEPYREIRYTADRFESPARFHEHGLMAYSFSKSLSLAGERIGYLAVQPACPDADELVRALSLANRILGFTNAPALWQHVVARCLGEVVDLAPYRSHRSRLLEALAGKGYEVLPPEGTFYLFPRTPGGDDEAFVRRAMERLLLLVPGGTFGRPGHLRLAFCTDEHTVDLAVERLPDARGD